MGRRFNRWLRAAARRGINVGTIHQAARTFTAAPRNRPKPKPKPKPKPRPAPPPKPAPPVKKNTVTLKPLVNRKGKVVGYGHFKGNEVQDRSKIPKSAPKTPAAKAKLKAAIAATPKSQITPAAQKKQKEVLQEPMGKKARRRANKAALHAAAVAAGMDSNQAAAMINNPNAKWQTTFNNVQSAMAETQAVQQQQDFVKQQNDALIAQQNRMAELQAQRDAEAKAAAAEAQRQADLLQAQRIVGSGTGRGGLKLSGIKERGKRASRSSRRRSLAMNQVNLSNQLQAALKQRTLNLG